MSPRIVLVHGLGRDLHDWDAVVPGLADLAECIAVDLAGFGTEPPPPDRVARPREVGPERMAALRAAVEARDLVPHADDAFSVTVRAIALQLLRPGPVRRAVASLRMPVTALYGRHDRLVPVRHAVRFKRLLPAADVRVLQHAGHLIQLEDPGDVVAAVRRQVTACSGEVLSTPGEGA